MKMSLAAAAALTVLSAAPASAAELLTNGGFESPTGYFTTYSGTQIPGWTVTVNNVDIASNAIYGSTSNYAYQGVQWLDLVGTGTNGAIAQTFATTTGVTCQLTFAYANNPDFSSAAASVGVTGVGVAGSLLSATFSHTGSTRIAAGWTLFTGTFVANAASTTLLFTDTSHNTNAGIYLDGVSVQDVATAVPEPAAWALMLTGFGGIGGAMRRRRRLVARAAALPSRG